MSSSTSLTRPGRVPVEHRLFGLDKRSFPYALFVVAVFLVWTVLIPLVNDAISWDDPVRAGEQLALTDTIAFTPVTGWNVESGYRVGMGGSAVRSGEASIEGDGGVSFAVVPDTFDGSPAQLLEQIAKVTSSTGDPTFRVDGDPDSLTTDAGDVGVIQAYRSINGDGLVAAFVLDGTGLKITAYGLPAQMSAAAQDIAAMIASIRSSDATRRAA